MAKRYKLPPRAPESDMEVRMMLEREKEMVQLHLKGKTYEELGEKLGMSTNAARNLGWREAPTRASESTGKGSGAALRLQEKSSATQTRKGPADLAKRRPTV